MSLYDTAPARPLPGLGPDAEPVVIVIDDDEAMRDALVWLIESVGLATRAYPSADAFLAAEDLPCVGCVVTDMRMPGTSGLGLIERLAGAGSHLPIIVVTAFANVRDAVAALQLGAVDFLEKPFHDQDLLDRINAAIGKTRDAAHDCCTARIAAGQVARLTEREYEVMRIMARGARNKDIARELGISPKTVEIHRQRGLAKLVADNPVDVHRRLDAAARAQGCGCAFDPGEG
jgi:FixJ family two-component response regulator